MVRSDRNYPNVYFGRPGSLVTLPWPRDGIDKPYERRTFDFATATGNHIVSVMLGGSRIFTLGWKALHLDNYRMLEQYWLGTMGPGPWALIDPSMPNLLMPNQSSTTNLYADARHFSVNQGSVSSNGTASQIHRTGATRSLRWLFTSAGSSFPVLTMTAPYRNWFGFPAMIGLPYRFSAWVKPDGIVDAAMTVSLKLQWLNAAGGLIDELSSGDIPVTAWQQLSVGGVAPALTAYAKPTVVLTGSTVAAGGSLYVDELLLEQDSVINTWAPGAGIRPVEILSLPDNVPFNGRFRKGVTMTVRELSI